MQAIPQGAEENQESNRHPDAGVRMKRLQLQKKEKK